MNRTKNWLCFVATALAAYGLVTSPVTAEEVEIGSKGPEFKAMGIDGQEYSLASTKGSKATVLAFTCNKCPVAVAYEDRFIDFQKKFASKGVKFIAINVNSSEDLAAMKQRAEEKGFNYPYAYDDSGDSARAYGARVTPHLFVLDENGVVVYRGAFDDKQEDPSKPHVVDAVNAVLSGKKPEVEATKAFGCGIKPNKK